MIENVRKGTSRNTAAQNLRWKEISQRCESHPHEAARLDRRGRTCLHAACAQQPPVNIVKVLIKACGRGGEALTDRDKHGRTPLAIAIASGASLDVFRLLLQTNTRAVQVEDSYYNYPLDLACAISNYEYERQTIIVKELLEVWPGAADFKEHGYRTPLYSAIEGSAHPDVIRMLAQANPNTVAGKIFTADAMPLMVAIRHNVPPEIIRLLIDAKPNIVHTMDQHGILPLWHAIEKRSSASTIDLLCPTLDIAIARNRVGRTALHYALTHSGPQNFAMLDTLMKRCSSSSPIRDIANLSSNSGETPLGMAYDRYIQTLRDGSNVNVKDLSVLSARSMMAWKTVLLLLKASYRYYYHQNYSRTSNNSNNNHKCSEDDSNENTDDDKFQVLHAALSTDAPIEIIQTALALYPKSAQQTDQYSDVFPLSLAISGPLTNKANIVHLVLDAYPPAIYTPDQKGNYPLFYAAAASARCSIISSTSSLTPTTAVHGKLLNDIFKSYPDALTFCEKETKLYPFMLAALPPPAQAPRTISSANKRLRQHKVSQAEYDLRQTDAIYNLLRNGPNVLNIFAEEQNKNSVV